VSAYIKVIGLAHLQPPVPPGAGTTITITDDVLERVAASPLTAVSPNIALHAVGFGEVVPGPDQMNGLGGRVGFAREDMSVGPVRDTYAQALLI